MHYFSSLHQVVLSRVNNGLTLLYPHQREALLALYQKASNNSNCRYTAYLNIGTSLGKTAIMAALPYIIAPWLKGKQILYLSDNCTLRSRFVDDFPVNRQQKPIYKDWILYKLGILPQGAIPPRVFEIEATRWDKTKQVIGEADFLVANRQFFIRLIQNKELDLTDIGLIVTDEAHYSASKTYKLIYASYPNVPLIYLSGSRYRCDAEPLPFVEYEEVEEPDEDGDLMVSRVPIADYQFSLQDAWKLEPCPIKKIAYQAASSQSFAIEEEGEVREISPEQFHNRAKSDRAWLREIVFAEKFVMPVLQMAMEILMSKRSQNDQPHAMLVRALNVKHCHNLKEILERNFPVLTGKIAVIHSNHPEFDLEGKPSQIIQEIQADKYWVVIHCAILGVGFDYKWFSISVCLGVLKSMSAAEQEWGRSLRKVPGEPAPAQINLSHPNQAVLITHESLDIRGLFAEYLLGTYRGRVRLPQDEPGKKRWFPQNNDIELEEDYCAGSWLMRLSTTNPIRIGSVLKFRVTQPNLPLFGQEVAVKVEAIVDEKVIQVTPVTYDFYAGSNPSVEKGDPTVSIFVDHIGLDWLIMVNGELVNYRDYKRSEILKAKKLEVNEKGEIVSHGVVLAQVMSREAYELLEGAINKEIEESEVEIPDASVVARPDTWSVTLQEAYGREVKKLIEDFLKKVPDRGEGKNLFGNKQVLKVLNKMESATNEFPNDKLLIYTAVFGHIKQVLKKEWSEHNSEEGYEKAVEVGQKYLKKIRVKG